MINKILFLLFFFVFAEYSPVRLQVDRYKGKVFSDNNSNGMMDPGEKGLADVLVSDGENVVKTNADGRFILPGTERTRFVFITTPDGYRISKYYLRVDKKVKEYLFGLHKVDKGGIADFRFIQITDSETYEYGEWIDILKEYINNEAPAFLVHTGDICYEKGLQFHSEFINSETMGTPVYYCLGNHDLLQGEYGEKMFEDLFGPVYYSFESGNVHFVVTPMLSGDHKPSFTREDVYRWLKNDLALVPEEKSIIIFNHSMLTRTDKFEYGINEDEKINLPDHNLIAWIYGHSHTNIAMEHGESGVISVGTAAPNKGGIDHTPSCFRVFHVDQKNDLTLETRYTYLDRHLVINTPDREHPCINQDGKITVSAQAYHSASPTEKVEFAIYRRGDKAQWRSMNRMSDWTWQAEWDPGQMNNNTELIVAVNARFADGVATREEHEFSYSGIRTINPEPEEAWPMFQGNAEHTGIAGSVILPPLQLAWVRNVEANIWMTSPIVAGGLVFIASIDDDNQGRSHVYAIDAKSGEIVWKFKTGNSVKNCIAFHDGKVFATDIQGMVYAIAAENGDLVWKKDLSIYGRTQEGTIASDNTIYTGGGNGLCALNASDGSEIWRNKSRSGGSGTIAPHMLGDGVLVVSANWRQLSGHDAATGELLWSHRDDTLRYRDGTATLHDGSLYLISRQNLLQIDPRTGNILKSRYTQYNLKSASTPVIADEYIIVGTGDKGLVAFNKTTFEEIWRFETGPALFMTVPYTRPVVRSVDASPVLSGDVVYFGASDGWFYGLDFRTGKEIWKIELGAPVFTSPAVSGNMIFIADFSGNIYGFTGSKNK